MKRNKNIVYLIGNEMKRKFNMLMLSIADFALRRMTSDFTDSIDIRDIHDETICEIDEMNRYIQNM